MARYNDSLIDLTRAVVEARQITYWVDEGGTIPTEKSNIAQAIGVSVDKTDDLLDMVTVLEDDPHFSLEKLDESEPIQGSKGKEYPVRVRYRLSYA